MTLKGGKAELSARDDVRQRRLHDGEERSHANGITGRSRGGEAASGQVAPPMGRLGLRQGQRQQQWAGAGARGWAKRLVRGLGPGLVALRCQVVENQPGC